MVLCCVVVGGGWWVLKSFFGFCVEWDEMDGGCSECSVVRISECWGDATDGRDVLRAIKQKRAGRAGVFGKPISIGGRVISQTTALKESDIYIDI